MVSTHSRLKAAGWSSFIFVVAYMCFNTQPPEGGWRWTSANCCPMFWSFNTQPPEGGWQNRPSTLLKTRQFQHTAA